MWHLSSPTRNWSCTPCIGSAESPPLDHHQWSPLAFWANLSRVFYHHFSVCLRKTPLTIKPEHRALPLGQCASQFWFHLYWNFPRFDYNSGVVEGWPTHLGCSRTPSPVSWGTLSPRKTRMDGHPCSHHSPDLGLSSVMGNYAFLKIFALNRIEWCLKWVKRESPFTLNNLMTSTKYCFEKGRKMVKTYSKWLWGCDPNLSPWKSQDGFKTENTWSEMNKASQLRPGACVHHFFIHSANRSFFLSVLSITLALSQVH